MLLITDARREANRVVHVLAKHKTLLYSVLNHQQDISLTWLFDIVTFERVLNKSLFTEKKKKKKREYESKKIGMFYIVWKYIFPYSMS